MSERRSIVIRIEPQFSPDEQKCVRCDHFKRPARIAPGTLHAALIEDDAQMDTRDRVVLCKLCEFFVRDALTSEARHC